MRCCSRMITPASPSTAVMMPSVTALGQTLANPELACPAPVCPAPVCSVASTAASTRRPTTTSAATPIPETSSSTPMMISSRRPACQVIASPAATSRGMSRGERPSPRAFSS